MMQKSLRVRIHGRVQGVWFRAWTQKTAQSLGLTGWVRNRSDGTVEAHFSGPAEAVEKMLELVWQGPAAARVDKVDAGEDAPVLTGFDVRPSK